MEPELAARRATSTFKVTGVSGTDEMLGSSRRRKQMRMRSSPSPYSDCWSMQRRSCGCTCYSDLDAKLECTSQGAAVSDAASTWKVQMSALRLGDFLVSEAGRRTS